MTATSPDTSADELRARIRTAAVPLPTRGAIEIQLRGTCDRCAWRPRPGDRLRLAPLAVGPAWGYDFR